MGREWIIGRVGWINLDADGEITGGAGFMFHGIDITDCRRSIDGEYAVIHSNKLTASQKNSIHGDMNFHWYDDTSQPTISEVMAIHEWTRGDTDG